MYVILNPLKHTADELIEDRSNGPQVHKGNLLNESKIDTDQHTVI